MIVLLFGYYIYILMYLWLYFDDNHCPPFCFEIFINRFMMF